MITVRPTVEPNESGAAGGYGLVQGWVENVGVYRSPGSPTLYFWLNTEKMKR